MKMKMILFVAVVAFAGCKKKASSSACNDAVGKAIDQMMAQSKAKMTAARANMPASMQAQMDTRMSQMDTIASKLKDVMSKDCVAQKWSSDMLKCMQTATSQPEIKKCKDMLTPDQQAKVQGDIMGVMFGAAGAPGAMHMHGTAGSAATPPPAAGSATAPAAGSAAAPAAGSATK